jgi:hypothetical protein
MAATNAQNDNTLGLFFNVINGAGAHHQNLDYLMQNVFSPNGGATGAHPLGTIPAVGITDHGPQFYGAGEVRLLFQTFFTAFPDAQILPQLSPGVPSKRLYSQDQTMIGIQTILAGTQKDLWFQHRSTALGLPDHYSPPLSDIEPDGSHKMQLPAAAAFNFDANSKISQLSLYFDRYLMNSQLFTGVTPPQAAIFSRVIEHALRKR